MKLVTGVKGACSGVLRGLAHTDHKVCHISSQHRILLILKICIPALLNGTYPSHNWPWTAYWNEMQFVRVQEVKERRVCFNCFYSMLDFFYLYCQNIGISFVLAMHWKYSQVLSCFLVLSQIWKLLIAMFLQGEPVSQSVVYLELPQHFTYYLQVWKV